MDWLDEFPTMERQELRALKKAIDLGFREFSRPCQHAASHAADHYEW